MPLLNTRGYSSYFRSSSIRSSSDNYIRDETHEDTKSLSASPTPIRFAHAGDGHHRVNPHELDRQDEKPHRATLIHKRRGCRVAGAGRATLIRHADKLMKTSTYFWSHFSARLQQDVFCRRAPGSRFIVEASAQEAPKSGRNVDAVGSLDPSCFGGHPYEGPWQ